MTRDQDACGLIQTKHTVPGSILYQLLLVPQRRQPHDDREPARHRAAASRSSSRSRPATSSSTSAATTARCSTATGPSGLRYLGFDPSDVARYAVEKGYDVVSDFFSPRRCEQRCPDQKAKVDHEHRDVLRPRGPARRSSPTSPRCLAEDGIWVMELHYLPLMLETNAFDAIVHEHLEYYSLAVLERLFGEEGLEVVDGRAQRHQRRLDPALHRPRRARTSARPSSSRRCRRCASASSSWRSTRPSPTRRSRRNSERVRDELSSAAAATLRAEGKTIHVYGASTKGNTILQYAGIDHHARSRTPPTATRTSGARRRSRTGIPIISEEESRAMKPDYYLVLPWHFLDEFLEREQEFLDARRPASSCRCPRCASSPSRPPGRKVRACQRGMWPSSASGVSACRWRSRSPTAAST